MDTSDERPMAQSSDADRGTSDGDREQAASSNVTVVSEPRQKSSLPNSPTTCCGRIRIYAPGVAALIRASDFCRKRLVRTLTMLIVLLVASGGIAFAFAGLRTDIDYCVYTAKSRTSSCFLGWAIRQQKAETDVSAWLRDEFGIAGPVKYVNFLNYHPLLPDASTPPGNWLSLTAMRDIYTTQPESRAAVAAYLKKLFSGPEPLVDGEFIRNLQGRYGPNR